MVISSMHCHLARQHWRRSATEILLRSASGTLTGRPWCFSLSPSWSLQRFTAWQNHRSPSTELRQRGKGTKRGQRHWPSCLTSERCHLSAHHILPHKVLIRTRRGVRPRRAIRRHMDSSSDQITPTTKVRSIVILTAEHCHTSRCHPDSRLPRPNRSRRRMGHLWEKGASSHTRQHWVLELVTMARYHR